MLDRYLYNAPIKNKLVTVHFIVTATALILVFMIMLVYEFFSFRQSMEEAIKVQASIIGNNSTAALKFGDKKNAQEVLSALRASGSIDQAIIFLPDGSPFATYRKNGASDHEVSAVPNQLGLETSLRNLTLAQDIELNNEIIGRLYLISNLDRFYYSLLLFAGAALTAAAFALAIARILLNPLNRSIIKPLSSLTRIMHLVSVEKDYTVRSRLDTRDEIGALAHGFNEMLAQIQQRDAELEEELSQRVLVEERLDHLAHYDSVTNLPNRHFFNSHLVAAIENALRSRTLTCLMFVDLDNFKIVNDTLGHHAGDLLLKEVAQRLCHLVGMGGIICRIGGDEFAVILVNLNQPEEADIFAAKIIDTLARTFFLENNEIYMGASVGISICPEHASDIATLLRNADTAMYNAKSKGKNNYQRYSPDMEGNARRRLTMETSLRRALAEQELMVYYQPQVNVKSGRIIGFEALLRWRHPKMGMISPVEFIPLAEETGLITSIGDWVLKTACMQGQAWQQTYALDLIVSVNLSGRQLKQNNIIENILNHVEQAGLPSHLLDIELTESTLMDNSKETIGKLEKLRAAGVRISIDDFGTGYSSMSYLKRFPIDTLKIDRSFIQDIPTDEDDVAITNAIIAMGSSLRMDVIAEGVETHAQLEFLRNSGCNKAQGFLFGRPMPAEEVEKLLRREEF